MTTKRHEVILQVRGGEIASEGEEEGEERKRERVAGLGRGRGRGRGREIGRERGLQSKWRDWEFLFKPTNIDKTPPVVLYMPGVDWQCWFLGKKKGESVEMEEVMI